MNDKTSTVEVLLEETNRTKASVHYKLEETRDNQTQQQENAQASRSQQTRAKVGKNVSQMTIHYRYRQECIRTLYSFLVVWDGQIRRTSLPQYRNDHMTGAFTVFSALCWAGPKVCEFRSIIFPGCSDKKWSNQSKLNEFHQSCFSLEKRYFSILWWLLVIERKNRESPLPYNVNLWDISDFGYPKSSVCEMSKACMQN